jgi:phage terminase large subunit
MSLLSSAGELNVQFPKKFRPLFEPWRYKVLFGGRGAAKSWQIARALLIKGSKEKLRILCAREIQKNIEESVHQLLCDQIVALHLEHFYIIQKNKIIGRNGTVFGYAGLKHNPKGIKSWEGADICWVEEADAVSSASWDILIPTIRKERLVDGVLIESEIWLSFNPCLEEDETFQRFVVSPPKNAVVLDVNWRDNPWFPQVLENERQESLRAVAEGRRRLDEHNHIWEGKCRAALDGAIFGDEMAWLQANGRICDVPYIPGIPIYTFWDIGRNDTTAIWFMQRIGMANRFIHFYENRLKDLTKYTDYLHELRVSRGYQYAAHYLPHDIEVTDYTREDNKSRREVFESTGVGEIETVKRTPDKREAHDQGKRGFASCWFDKEGCKDGLHALRHYVRKYDDKNKVFLDERLHNWASNAADAYLQYAQGFCVDDNPATKSMNGWRSRKTRRSARTV